MGELRRGALPARARGAARSSQRLGRSVRGGGAVIAPGELRDGPAIQSDRHGAFR